MGKEVTVYVYNGVLFSYEKEGNPVFLDNMDEINQTGKKNTAWYYLCVESEKQKQKTKKETEFWL